MDSQDINLSVNVGGLRLKNPVMPASGTFGYGMEFADFIDLKALGAIIVKGTTLEPRLGNHEYRFTEVAGCASNFTIGLQNVGLERFIADKLPFLRGTGTPVIVNIAGRTVEEYVTLTKVLSETEGVAAIEINMACPNAEGGGRQFCADINVLSDLVGAVRRATDLTVLAKFASAPEQVGVLARACQESGADAVCPIYGVVGMSIDIHTRRPTLGRNVKGAVGGPWRKPIALWAARQAVEAVRIPVVGCGGVCGPEDALEYLIAGATAVQIGTFNLINPRVTVETIDGIRDYLYANGISTVMDLVGSLQLD